jgi:hypothetical protein
MRMGRMTVSSILVVVLPYSSRGLVSARRGLQPSGVGSVRRSLLVLYPVIHFFGSCCPEGRSAAVEFHRRVDRLFKDLGGTPTLWFFFAAAGPPLGHAVVACNGDFSTRESA